MPFGIFLFKIWTFRPRGTRRLRKLPPLISADGRVWGASPAVNFWKLHTLILAPVTPESFSIHLCNAVEIQIWKMNYFNSSLPNTLPEPPFFHLLTDCLVIGTVRVSRLPCDNKNLKSFLNPFIEPFSPWLMSRFISHRTTWHHCIMQRTMDTQQCANYCLRMGRMWMPLPL